MAAQSLGMDCGGSELGGEQTWGPEHKGMAAAPKCGPVVKLLYGYCGKADPVFARRRPMFLWEVTGRGTIGTLRGRVQAPTERFAEITSGRTNSQHELATTCKDPLYRETEVSGRGLVWRMSRYEH
jgi:hypothetical protein